VWTICVCADRISRLAGCMYRIRESAGDGFLGSGVQVLKVYVDVD